MAFADTADALLDETVSWTSANLICFVETTDALLDDVITSNSTASNPGEGAVSFVESAGDLLDTSSTGFEEATALTLTAPASDSASATALVRPGLTDLRDPVNVAASSTTTSGTATRVVVTASGAQYTDVVLSETELYTEADPTTKETLTAVQSFVGTVRASRSVDRSEQSQSQEQSITLRPLPTSGEQSSADGQSRSDESSSRGFVDLSWLNDATNSVVADYEGNVGAETQQRASSVAGSDPFLSEGPQQVVPTTADNTIPSPPAESQQPASTVADDDPLPPSSATLVSTANGMGGAPISDPKTVIIGTGTKVFTYTVPVAIPGQQQATQNADEIVGALPATTFTTLLSDNTPATVVISLPPTDLSGKGQNPSLTTAIRTFSDETLSITLTAPTAVAPAPESTSIIQDVGSTLATFAFPLPTVI